jgi:UDP-GlcNAc:undecaprenyl-phosphate GlcNAc-1-phosphate transferase
MVGVLDDHQNISVPLRLLLQVLVAIIVVTVGGTAIESYGNLFGRGEVILNEWANLVTILAIIAGMNAVNMADGIHGLAGGNSLITCIAIVYLSIGSVFFHETLFIAFLLCSVLPVFLIHNLCLGISESKRVFMGDAGSMFIGLTIALLLIDLSQGEGRAFAPVTALWLFAVPLIEMVTVILRRLTSGMSPFMPDLYHSHHLLLRLGIKEKNTLIIMLLISLFMAVIGILGELYGVTEWIMFIGFLLVFVIYVVWYVIVFRSVKNISN